MEQVALTLMPETPPDLEQTEKHPEELTVREIPKPSKALIDSVRNWGVIQPVFVHRNVGDDDLVVVDGNRRVLAARNADVMVPCVITENLAYLKHVATLMLNNLRSPNLIAETESIDALLAQGATVETIAQMTGSTVATVKKRLRLRNLTPEVRAMVDSGKVKGGVAERIAKLSKAEQDRVVATVKARDVDPDRPKGTRMGTITDDDVSAVRRAVNQHAAITSTADLFGTQPGVEAASASFAAIRIESFVRSLRKDGVSLADLTKLIRAEWNAQDKAEKGT